MVKGRDFFIGVMVCGYVCLEHVIPAQAGIS